MCSGGCWGGRSPRPAWSTEVPPGKEPVANLQEVAGTVCKLQTWTYTAAFERGTEDNDIGIRLEFEKQPPDKEIPVEVAFVFTEPRTEEVVQRRSRRTTLRLVDRSGIGFERVIPLIGGRESLEFPVGPLTVTVAVTLPSGEVLTTSGTYIETYRRRREHFHDRARIGAVSGSFIPVRKPTRP